MRVPPPPRRCFRDAGSPTSDRVLLRHAAPHRVLRLVNNVWFALGGIRLLRAPKVVLALTPPPWIQNIGDQAQTVAILAWIRRTFPDRAILELNQSETGYFLPALRLLIRPHDLILLHSGGNLGDRYPATERPRRALIRGFPRNRIVSLPQTICFADTEAGRAERDATAASYGTHPDLRLICRDRVSARAAVAMFPRAKLYCLPDFVLSLPSMATPPAADGPPILICRRLDRESRHDAATWDALAGRLASPVTFWDTRLDEPIPPGQREARLAETLRLVAAHRVVVTDRFHAIVFAILCGRPCVALPAIDHKVSSSRHWFRGVLYAETPDDVPALVEQALTRGFVPEEDWNARYFDRLAELLGLGRSAPVAPESVAPAPATRLAGRWQPVAPYQRPAQLHEDGDALRFEGAADSDDEWCFVRTAGDWHDFTWTLDVCRHTDFREFAFNFRYHDFDNRYRYRFEGGRLYFDKKQHGRWHNHLASVPVSLPLGVSRRIEITARGERFVCFVDGRLALASRDADLAGGGLAVVAWETDGRTPIRASVRGARVRRPGVAA